MAADAAKSQKMLAHIVFFSLKDDSDSKRQELIDGCKKYLVDHAGLTYFAVGGLSDLKRDVNDRDFDVALHLVFENREAHDRYQVAPRHNEFVEKFKANWAKVRVFDSNITTFTQECDMCDVTITILPKP